jgi:hypothetical protein
VSGDQVAAVGGAIRLADDNVRVDLWSVSIERHIAQQGENFRLLADVDPPVVLLLSVKPSVASRKAPIAVK